MTGVPVKELQNKRAEYAKEWAAQLQAVIVLKEIKPLSRFPMVIAGTTQPETGHSPRAAPVTH